MSIEQAVEASHALANRIRDYDVLLQNKSGEVHADLHTKYRAAAAEAKAAIEEAFK
jgi:hypothetical protein